MKFNFTLFLSLFIVAFASNTALAADYEAGKIYDMPPYKIANIIKKTEGHKRIIMIYASWCPICVAKMPHIMDLERKKAGSVIAVSVDEKLRNLSRYIKRLKDVPFKVILNKGTEYKLHQHLKQFGVKEWEGVPEIILLDENNKVIGQGNYSMDYIEEFLFKGAL